jgi:hypothetical protein
VIADQARIRFDLKHAGQGALATLVGLLFIFPVQWAWMYTGIPFYISGYFFGLFPTLILFDDRHWSNKLFFGMVYTILGFILSLYVPRIEFGF